MSNELIPQHLQQQGDSLADAIAAAVIITVLILTAILWISGH